MSSSMCWYWEDLGLGWSSLLYMDIPGEDDPAIPLLSPHRHTVAFELRAGESLEDAAGTDSDQVHVIPGVVGEKGAAPVAPVAAPVAELPLALGQHQLPATGARGAGGGQGVILSGNR